MGWSDLFKSKSSKTAGDGRVRWFGKLPSYPDYYSSPSDEEWAVEFNDWVLKGFEVYQSRSARENARKQRLPISACVLRLPKSAMTVLASILDYGGDMRGRPFPMCFYVGIPTGQWLGPTSDRLSGVGRVLRDLLAMRREIPRFINSPGRFENVFGGREVDLDGVDGDSRDATWTEQARTVPLSRWFDSAKTGLQIEDASAWFGVATRWGDSIAELESKKFQPTLRFPLSAGIATEVQTAGWIRWLEARMDLTRRTLSLFISGELDTGIGRLSIVARDLMPDDFLLLTPLFGMLTYVDDLCGMKLANSDSAAAPSSRAFPNERSWLDFVEARAAAS